MHSCAIKVAVVLKSEIVSYCFFTKTSSGSFYAAQMGKLQTHVFGQGIFCLSSTSALSES